MTRRVRYLTGIVVLLLAGCTMTPASARPSPAVTAATTTASVPVSPTTTDPTSTSVPTLAPTPTTIPTPTVAASPTVAPTPTPAATATPAARSPLTGLALADPRRLEWQPLAVQIDNDPAARPHTGLAAAGVVIETPTEAGLTRFTAIYLDNDAPVVGPVRSARLVNLEVIPEYGALLASAGGADGVIARIVAAGLPHINLIGSTGGVGAWRANDRPAPYNLYVSTDQLRANARTLGLERPATVAAGAFGPVTEVPGVTDAPASAAVGIPYQHGAVRFVYDPASGGYQRSVDGVPHRDVADGAWLAPRNVVVQMAAFTQTNIVEDMFGSRSLAVQLRGKGELLLLRDGKLFRGSWQRANLTDRTTYLDEAGRPLTLTPGQTWVALVPIGMPVTVEP